MKHRTVFRTKVAPPKASKQWCSEISLTQVWKVAAKWNFAVFHRFLLIFDEILQILFSWLSSSTVHRFNERAHHAIRRIEQGNCGYIEHRISGIGRHTRLCFSHDTSNKRLSRSWNLLQTQYHFIFPSTSLTLLTILATYLQFRLIQQLVAACVNSTWSLTRLCRFSISCKL